MAHSLLEDLSGADADTLHEVIREAESYLSAQLMASLAADQRAIAFSSVVAAGTVVVGGGGVALLEAEAAYSELAWVASAIALGLLAAMFFAILSAMPSHFWFIGNSPELWRKDLVAGTPLKHSLAQQAAHYAEMISANDKIMVRNAKQMAASVWIAWGSLLFGSLFSALVLTDLIPAICA